VDTSGAKARIRVSKLISEEGMNTHIGQMRQWNEDDRYINVHVIDDVVMYECKEHVRMSKDDWKRIQQRLISARKQGDKEHGKAVDIGVVLKPIILGHKMDITLKVRNPIRC